MSYRNLPTFLRNVLQQLLLRMGVTYFSETVANFCRIIRHYTPEGIFFLDPTVNTSTVTEVTEFDFRFPYSYLYDDSL